MKCTAFCPFQEGHIEYCEPYVFWVITCKLRNKTEVYRSRVKDGSHGKCLVAPAELKGFLTDIRAEVDQVLKDLEAEVDLIAAQREAV